MAHKSPSVCIVVPVLNEARYIRASMDSLLAQDYRPLEIIVYDGGSTDGTLEALRSYPVEVNVVAGLGQMAAINRGWIRTSADFVGWWAGDDLLKPGAISALARELDLHPNAGFVHADGEIIDEAGLVIRKVHAGPIRFADLVIQFAMMPQSTLIRRSALKRSGMMDERRRLAADWDLFLRLAQYCPIAYVPFVASQRRMHSESEDAKNVEGGGLAVGDVLGDFFSRADLTSEQRSLLKYAIATSALQAGWSYAVVGKRQRAFSELMKALRNAPTSLWKSPVGWRLMTRLCLPINIEPNQWLRIVSKLNSRR